MMSSAFIDDTGSQEQETQLDNGDEPSKSSPVFYQVQLGSKQSTMTLDNFIQNKATDKSFENFFKKLAELVDIEWQDEIDYHDKVCPYLLT